MCYACSKFWKFLPECTVRPESIFRCFSSVFFSSNQRGRAVTKTQSTGKNTICEQALAILDTNNQKRAHIAPAVDLLHTRYVLSGSSGKNCNHTLHDQSTGSTPSFPISVYGIDRRACVSGFHFSQNINVELVPLQCVCFSNYRKRGSASYIVREVRSVRERERERESEAEVTSP